MKYMHEEIASILNLGHTCCHMIQNLLSSCVLSKNIDIRKLTYESIMLPVSLYGYQTWYLNLSKEHRLRVFKSRVLRKMCGFEREQVKKLLTFRHRASSILGQVFCSSPENTLYIFNQQIYFII